MEQEKLYKVSVVTAVYNVEEYLEEMIESIIAQSIGFENVQLILVDDGSVDMSGEICDKYAEQFPDNIVVVHKENGGVSSARNEGLEHVKGEYINFCDADDKLQINALEKMYEYLEENKEWIDLVAIPLKFFGAKTGEHLLNFKFKTPHIVDLRKEYQYVQLAINSVLVKRECFFSRRFDESLAYAEDAQVIQDILLDTMRYGVLNGTCYFYRKRENETSALDTGATKKGYYLLYIRRFVLFTLENAKRKKGYIPKFVQYTCMSDLQWRLKQSHIPVGVLTEVEYQEYRDLIVKSLQYIDNNIILEQKNLSDNYKMAILELKEQDKKRTVEKYRDNIRICVDDISSAYLSTYSAFYELLNIEDSRIIIEGYVRCFSNMEPDSILIKNESENGEVLDCFLGEWFEREEKNTYMLDEVITKAWGFRIAIERQRICKGSLLALYIRLGGHDVRYNKIVFGKFFPLDKRLNNAYFLCEDLLFTYCNEKIKIDKVMKNTFRCREKALLNEIWDKNDKMLRRGCIARILYHLLKQVKKKEIWLISDRLTKADDNGEAFFTFMNKNGINKSVKSYFVIEKESSDYERIKKVGQVVSFNSLKYKILCLLCDKIISAHGEDRMFNRFFELNYLYKDILHKQKFVFLQHGIIQNDMCSWLNKYNKNISMFVTSTKDEYKSILTYPYYYNEEQVKLTGMPRYDYLKNEENSKKYITFMPTWRSYLAGILDNHTDERKLNCNFVKSTYYQMYQDVLTNQRLYKSAERYGYELCFMLHPSMPEEARKYFEFSKKLKIFDRSTRYRYIYEESSLLITDYSSAVFDFAYLRKPVLYYQKDKDEFFSGKHTLVAGYFDYERNGFGEVEYNADDLINRIVEYMESGCQLKEKYQERIKNTFPYCDRNNCQRVYEEIVKI